MAGPNEGDFRYANGGLWRFDGAEWREFSVEVKGPDGIVLQPGQQALTENVTISNCTKEPVRLATLTRGEDRTMIGIFDAEGPAVAELAGPAEWVYGSSVPGDGECTVGSFHYHTMTR